MITQPPRDEPIAELFNLTMSPFALKLYKKKEEFCQSGTELS